MAPEQDALRDWLLGRALPLWLRHGIDVPAQAFHEHLDPAHLGCDAAFRRLRVAARQVYVFALAAREGVEGAEAACRLGARFLEERAALPGGGYAWRFDLANRVTDPTLDLYDHAFVLLAWATAAPVVGAGAAARARGVRDLLTTRFRHAAGGFQESLPPALPRRQNPHMHLLEALLAAEAAFPGDGYAALAGEVLRLFHTRLLPPGTALGRALPELFSDTLAPEPATRYAVEPGHHHEWAWLLCRADSVLGANSANAAAASALLAFADRHGLHPQTGDVIDEVRADGGDPRLTARLWPQTERLKSAIRRPDATTQSGVAAARALLRWLRPDGTFIERRDAAGNPIAGPMPASSLYHLTCAILAG